LLIAIVGAKGQGKTWVARQFLRNAQLQQQLPSGDLQDDSTILLTWIGETKPKQFDASQERFVQASRDELKEIGQPYTLLDTPGTTDGNLAASQIALASLSLAPIKLLVIDRTQLRAAANLNVARWIDGGVCIPIVTAIEPDEIDAAGSDSNSLAKDLRDLVDQLRLQSPNSQMHPPVLVPDFEITNDEKAAGQTCATGILDALAKVFESGQPLASTAESRRIAADQRLRFQTTQLIHDRLPKLSMAVGDLTRATENLPEQVLESVLGSSSVLETGLRMRLRTRMISDTPLLFFPYRTVMGTLNLTQGAWDRLMLAMAGSLPSLFGAFASWAGNIRAGRSFALEIDEGLRKRAEQQIDSKVRPLCDRFHRTILRQQANADAAEETPETRIQFHGIDQLQTASREIFEDEIDTNAVPLWRLYFQALIGMLIFWTLMSGPVIIIYRDYLAASYQVFTGGGPSLTNFPHPTPGLLFTSLTLSIIPLAIYCMIVLTFSLRRRRIRQIADSIIDRHQRTIAGLREEGVIRLAFDNELLTDAQFLVGLDSGD
jgi:hypothetical protein